MRNQSNWTPKERKDEIAKKCLAMRSEGLTLIDAVERFGIPHGTLRRWVKEYEDSLNDGPKGIS